MGFFGAVLGVSFLSAWAGTEKPPISGPQPGDSVYAFEPWHVSGPDKGTNTCPICKYGKTAAVQMWVNQDSAASIVGVAQALDKEIAHYGAARLKAFVVQLNSRHEPKSKLSAGLTSLANRAHTPTVAFTFLPNANDPAIEAYRINTQPNIKNTVVVYVNRKAVATFVNFKLDGAGRSNLHSAIAKSVSGFRRVKE